MAPLRRGRDPAARRTSGTTVVSPRRATNLGDDAEGAPSSAAGLESPPGSGGEGGSPGVGGLRKSDGTSAGGLGALRTVQAPPPRTTRTSEPIILPHLEVESRLTSTRWRARRRRTEAQASAFGNAPSSSLLLVTAPGRVPGRLVVTWRARLVQDAPASCWPNSWGGEKPWFFLRVREQRASRGAWGGVLHLEKGDPPPKIAQGRSVGEF